MSDLTTLDLTNDKVVYREFNQSDIDAIEMSDNNDWAVYLKNGEDVILNGLLAMTFKGSTIIFG